MKIKLYRKKIRTYFILISSSLLLLGALPYFAGSGLDEPKPIGPYINGNFPSSLPQGTPYTPVFSNLSFDSPLTFNELPTNDRIIVGQRDGQIFWFDKTPNVAVKNSLLDLSEKVGVVWDGGFLGLALHPQFGTAGKNYFYVWYTTEDANSNDFPDRYTTQSCDSEEYWGNFLVLARYEIDPISMETQESSEQILLKLRMYGTTHRGGGLLFGDDGFLYLTTGDQTAFRKSQDIFNNLDGGVLRMDVDQDPTKSHPPVRTMPADHGYSDEISGNGYWIPNDNPFLSPGGENFEEYYSMGHRNPHRMTKDRETGKLYIGEIGGGRHEEINIVKKGGNFGWPIYEGFFRSNNCLNELYNNMPHEQPLLAFPRAEANAIIGGYVYRGSEVPELHGKYICADYGNGEEIFTVDINTGSYEQYGNFASTNIISFGEDKQGELYIMKQGVSTLFKLTSKNISFGNTPTLLSQTGAFSNLNTLTPTDGLIPYDLVESFWSDGALKKRWMAIPNDGNHDTSAEKITYSDIGDWDFPIGSVLVKHFELPIDENDPQITKRLETRFSVKASDGKFYFVTYKWNDQQTDAELLASGLDEDITISLLGGGTNTQTWTYPNIADCASCHNSATGGTLGTKTRFLNKDYTYTETGRTANQLVTLSHLGMLNEVISDADTGSLLTSKAQDDMSASLEDKARSYLDLNCAYCHRSDAGTRANFDLRLNLDFVQTGLLEAQPNVPLGIPNEQILDPGSPETSILYHRMNSADPTIRMPALAKNKIDTDAVQLIDEWIRQLDGNPCGDKIIMERFNDVPGTTLAELKNHPNYPNSPNQVAELNEFRIPINVADDYGVRVKGLLKAPETGIYYFWVTGDDNVELNLSTNEDESNKTRIAYHNNWSLDGEWNKYDTQKSIGINLEAGQVYYMEALMNERGGGDNLSVGWRKPSNGNGTVPFQVIPCTAFDFFSGPPVIAVTGVSLSPDAVTLVEGNTQQLDAAISPSNATDLSLLWLSSDENIATVGNDGLVTAVAEGTATIAVRTNDGGLEAISAITVMSAPVPVTGVSVSPDTLNLTVGENQQLIASISPVDADDQNMSWFSSDTAIATVRNDGLVTAIAEGIATITVRTNDGGFEATTTVTVERAIVSVTGVTLDPTALTLTEGETSNLIATVSPADADDQTVTWSSNDISIATVDSNGFITAVTEGIATITATTNDGGFGATSTITVESAVIPVTGITVTPLELNLLTGTTSVLVANIIPQNATNGNVIWSSSNGNVASVNNNGVVNAIGAGTAIITVTTLDGAFEATSTVTVSRPVVGVTGVTLDQDTLTLTEGETSNLTATVSPADADDPSVSWSSSDDSVATVDTDGQVTAVSSGTATITVMTTDGNFTANVSVTVSDSGTGCNSGTVILDLDFESGASGWTTSGTARTGTFVVGDPTFQTTSGVTTQLEDDHSTVGTNAYFTATNTSVGRDDVDAGVSTATSPIYTIDQDAELSLWYFFGQRDAGDDPNGDFFRLEYSLDGGSSYITLASHADERVNAHWTEATATIPGGSSLVIRISASDGPNAGDIVEAGLDDITVISQCGDVVPVTSVTVAPTTLTLTEGETSNLTASVSPSDADDLTVTWSSSDDGIATVDANGLVTAIAEGTATVTVTTSDGGFTAQSTVNVTPANPNVCTASGSILMQRYDDILGSSIGALTGSPDYPYSPSSTKELGLFEIQSNQGDNFGVRVSGYLCAPETGTYYFWIAGNNHVQLNLSTTSSETDKATIAYHTNWTGSRQWDKFPTQRSVGITLQQGGEYYIEALMKESGSGDNLAVGWRRPDDGAGELPVEVVPGDVLSPFVPQEIQVTGVTLDPVSIDMPENSIGTLTATVLPANATDRSVIWSSSDESVASVNGSGQVIAVSEGTATVTVTTSDGGFTAQSTVNVTPANPNVCTASGSILMQRYDDILGSSIGALTGSPDYPYSPSSTKELGLFEIQSNQGDNFGVRVSGYLCAPETGTYYFWIAGNNHVQLNLSTTSSETDKATIAYHTNWTGSRQWDKFPTQRSVGITLQQGGEYYIEALMKESGSGDNLAVGWRRPDDGAGELPVEVVPGDVLSPAVVNPSPLRAWISPPPGIGLDIYPNPARDVLNILLSNGADGKIGNVHVYDALGRKVMSIDESDMYINDGAYGVELIGLETGLYFLYVQMDGGQLLTERFIKE